LDVPELPEVETIARGLDAALAGRVIERATLHARDLYRPGSRRLEWLAGGRIRSVERFGKAILFHIDAPPARGARGERVLVVHLGMTGKFLLAGSGGSPVLPRGDGTSSRPDPATARHLHGRFVFRGGGELYYIDPRRFGYFYAGSPEGLSATLNIGPDPFQTRSAALARALSGRTAPVKALLLDQRLISGLGNIYVDELLFETGIHPSTPGVAAAPQARDILTAARRVLRRALRAGGTTFRDYRRPDGSRGAFQRRLVVYGRAGEACVRCGAKVVRIVVAGRGTHLCPRCQRAPRSRSGRRR
jgi:formamidopyrimidine-DNA glycosylase